MHEHALPTADRVFGQLYDNSCAAEHQMACPPPVQATLGRATPQRESLGANILLNRHGVQEKKHRIAGRQAVIKPSAMQQLLMRQPQK